MSPELIITILVNLVAIGASYVGLRVQIENRLTRLETHLDLLARGEKLPRRRSDPPG